MRRTRSELLTFLITLWHQDMHEVEYQTPRCKQSYPQLPLLVPSPKKGLRNVHSVISSSIQVFCMSGLMFSLLQRQKSKHTCQCKSSLCRCRETTETNTHTYMHTHLQGAGERERGVRKRVREGAGVRQRERERDRESCSSPSMHVDESMRLRLLATLSP